MLTRKLALLAALAATTAVASADQIVFKNGDKLTGKVVMLAGGKMKITSAVAGEVIVDVKDIATFSTDAPIEIRTEDGQVLNLPATASETDQIKAGEQVVTISTIKMINPPAQVWTGALVASGMIVRGNTNTDDLAIDFDATLRRKDDTHDDRTTAKAGYHLGIEDDVTTTDNWFVEGKYDKFFDPKLYGYGIMRVDRDRIADLNYRLSPGIGLGYQWIERADLKFNTEAGVSYIYEDYRDDGTEEHVAARFAWHLDKKLNDKIDFFHNFEIFPAFEDPHDFNLITDAGVRMNLTDKMFAQFKVEWKHDSTPAPDADKNDYRYLLGVGWRF